MTLEAADLPTRYCGRTFTASEVRWIRSLIASHPESSRAALSREVCDGLGWLRPDGRRKDMSCRVAMLRMERDGLLTLPPPRNRNGNGAIRPAFTAACDPKAPLRLRAGQLGELVFRPVESRQDSSVWNELIERYHYLGHKPLPGAQLRYLVFSHRGQLSVDSGDEQAPYLLAAVGFGAAAWAVAPRGRFIGWTPQQRAENLHLIANNARFLIVPWITSRNLASRILALVAKRLPSERQARYGYRPVLLETFVERERFHGTCYRAANWAHVGETQGRGKLDRRHRHPLPIKDIFLYPLHKRYRQILCSSS